MLRRELKINFKSFLIWTTILVVLFLAVFSIYPSIISSDNIQMIDEMIKMFPEEMLKAFNMDGNSWQNSQGCSFTRATCYFSLLHNPISFQLFSP